MKLATQLMSRSVAQALIYCKDKLEIQEFSGAEATIKFITIFNDAFDILNSHKLSGVGYKQALCEQNIKNVEKFYEDIYSYIKTLKLIDNTLLTNSEKSTGFVGILIALKSVINIFKRYVQDLKLLSFIPCYKLNQDHLEFFLDP